MVFNDLLKTTASKSKLETMVRKVVNQLKQEKWSNKEKKLKIIDLQENIIALGANPDDPEPVQSLVKENDVEIQVLKEKHKIPTTEHVQTKELMEFQQEKEKLVEQVMELNEKVNQYETLFVRLEKEKQEATTVKPPPSSQVSSEVTPEDASEELDKTLSQLNFKEVEVEQLKRTISTQEEQVVILLDQIKEREFLISEAEKTKTKLQKGSGPS
jgi:hypothetical protein